MKTEISFYKLSFIINVIMLMYYTVTWSIFGPYAEISDGY